MPEMPVPRVTFRVGAFTTAVLVPLLGCGPSAGTSPAPSPSGGTSAGISAADLRTRLYVFSDDSMQGRRSVTPGNVKATDWIAAEARRIGLEPAGDDGSWFQTVPILQRTLDPATALTVEGTTFKAWDDIIPRDQGTGARPVDGARAIYGGTWDGELISPEQAAGRLVVVTFPPVNGVPVGSVNRAQTTQRFLTAAGIVVATLDAVGASERLDLQDAGAQVARAEAGPETPAFMYATTRVAEALLGAPLAGLQPGAEGRTVSGTVRFVDTPAEHPARNVVAVLRGSDPALSGQYVAVGAHNDHDGIGPETLEHDSLRAFNLVMRPEGANSTPGEPTADQSARIRAILDSLRRERKPRADSVLNGADDDGSGSVAALEIAEHLAQGTRPKRSVLFVWHTAEEMGLLGADWFTRHPTVPRDSIVAQLNADMIGRGGAADRPGGGPAYIQMIGSRRLSTELGDLVDRVNAEGGHGFEFDYTYDADGHPDNYYCRSDHYMYARFGIPIAFFSTGSHVDYHQLTDEPQYINYDKLARVTRLIADVARTVADLDHRVVVDKPKPDPDGVCQQ